MDSRKVSDGRAARASAPAGPLVAGAPAAGPMPRTVRHALQILRAACCEPISLCDLAARCGVPERTLCHQFSQTLGVSPMRYLRDLRLAAVHQALRSAGGQSVTQIAAQHQFPHHGRFAKAYAQRYGESPSTTLRRARQSLTEPPPGAAPRTAARPTLYVIDPRTLSHGAGLDAFADSCAKALAGSLADLGSCEVVLARSLPRREAPALSRRYALAVDVRKLGGTIEVSLTLSDLCGQVVVWGWTLSAPQDEVRALRERAARVAWRSVGGAILRRDIALAAQRPDRDRDAASLVLRAVPLLFSSTGEGALRALEHLETAMIADPDDARAVALAAWAHGQIVMYNSAVGPVADVHREEAARLFARAAILGDADPLTLAAQSAVATMLGDLRAGLGAAREALRIDPTLGWAWSRVGWVHAYRGEYAGAARAFSRAMALDHRASRGNTLVGLAASHFGAGDYAGAARRLDAAMALQPGLTWANRSLSVCCARLGETALAHRAVGALRRARPDLTVQAVCEAVPFPAEFLERLGNGLDDLGLPAR